MNYNIINVPIKYGCDQDGVDMAFDKLIASNLIDLFTKERDNQVKVTNIELQKIEAKDKHKDNKNLKYLYAVTDANEKLAGVIYNALQDGEFPFVIGGDHSLAIGSIAGASKYFSKFAVVYIDAHFDFNTTESSLTHNIHGMPLASSMNFKNAPLSDLFYSGRKLNPKDLYHIGAHDIDKEEYLMAEEHSLDLYPMSIVKEVGLDNILHSMVEKLTKNKYNGVHLSFDIDSLNSSYAPGTGYSSNKGFTIDDVKIIFISFLETGLITSIDFVEYNPMLDDINQTTLKTSLELIDFIVGNLYK